MQMIDSTTAKAHRSAAGRKGGAAQAIGRSRGGRTTKNPAVALLAPLPPGRLCAADTAYDSNGLRQFLTEHGTRSVIPNNPTRKHRHPLDTVAYRQRDRIERTFCGLKDFRRIATRYDKLAVNFAAAVALAAIIIWWA